MRILAGLMLVVSIAAHADDFAAARQDLVDELRKAKYSDLLPSYNSVAYLEGRASFADDGSEYRPASAGGQGSLYKRLRWLPGLSAGSDDECDLLAR